MNVQDYLVTHYVAEFFNTLTSLAYSESNLHQYWKSQTNLR